MPVRLEWTLPRRMRVAAKKTRDGPQARRLLALAAIYDGGTRSDAAKIGGVTLQKEPRRHSFVTDASYFLLPTTGHDSCTDFNVAKPGKTAPNDGVAWRWITYAREITAQPGELGHIVRKRLRFPRGGSYSAVKQTNLRLSQHTFWGCIRLSATDHGHPEDAPAHDAEDRDQIRQALCRPKLRVLCFAAGF
jgi:hypothetical protein